jgi:hypothetical protein
LLQTGREVTKYFYKPCFKDLNTENGVADILKSNKYRLSIRRFIGWIKLHKMH